MLPALFGLLSLILITKADSLTDEWRPISRERVFNSRSFIKTQVNKNSLEARSAEPVDTFENIKSSNLREMLLENFDTGDVDGEDNAGTSKHSIKDISGSFLPAKTPRNLKIQPRQAKTFNEDKHTRIENLIKDVNEKEKGLNSEESKPIEYTTYSVTESNSDQSNTHDYDYTPLKEPQHNPTDDFLKILLNYNIRTSDKLPNYALSLRQNSRHSNNDFVFMPVRIPTGYNSPNHLLVDPLLAVFLSNYGYYLPGLYGITGNYRNLYGYVAANNIHNNKPFGSYKIYSDTDFYQ